MGGAFGENLYTVIYFDAVRWWFAAENLLVDRFAGSYQMLLLERMAADKVFVNKWVKEQVGPRLITFFSRRPAVLSRTTAFE